MRAIVGHNRRVGRLRLCVSDAKDAYLKIIDSFTKSELGTFCKFAAQKEMSQAVCVTLPDIPYELVDADTHYASNALNNHVQTLTNMSERAVTRPKTTTPTPKSAKAKKKDADIETIVHCKQDCPLEGKEQGK